MDCLKKEKTWTLGKGDFSDGKSLFFHYQIYLEWLRLEMVKMEHPDVSSN